MINIQRRVSQLGIETNPLQVSEECKYLRRLHPNYRTQHGHSISFKSNNSRTNVLFLIVPSQWPIPQLNYISHVKQLDDKIFIIPLIMTILCPLKILFMKPAGAVLNQFLLKSNRAQNRTQIISSLKLVVTIKINIRNAVQRMTFKNRRTFQG